MTSDEREALAMKRFNTLNLVRLIGAACAVAGVANIGGRLFPEFSPWLGYILLLNAFADVFLVPALLKKSWRRQDGAQG